MTPNNLSPPTQDVAPWPPQFTGALNTCAHANRSDFADGSFGITGGAGGGGVCTSGALFVL